MEYNKFVKYVDWADQDLSYRSILWKTLKWSKKVILYLVFVENWTPPQKLDTRNFYMQPWDTGSLRRKSITLPWRTHKEFCQETWQIYIGKEFSDGVKVHVVNKKKYEVKCCCRFWLVSLHKGRCFESSHPQKHYYLSLDSCQQHKIHRMQEKNIWQVVKGSFKCPGSGSFKL